jgi:hypothetical protein
MDAFLFGAGIIAGIILRELASVLYWHIHDNYLRACPPCIDVDQGERIICCDEDERSMQ